MAIREYRLLVIVGLTTVLVAGGVTVTAYALIRHDRSYSRPYGIPAAVSDSQIDLMQLSPVPVRPAPGFGLADGEAEAFFAPGQRFAIWADGAVGRTIRAEGLVGQKVISPRTPPVPARPDRGRTQEMAASVDHGHRS